MNLCSSNNFLPLNTVKGKCLLQHEEKILERLV